MKNNENTVKTADMNTVVIAKQDFVDEFIKAHKAKRIAPASVNGIVMSREEALSYDFR